MKSWNDDEDSYSAIAPDTTYVEVDCEITNTTQYDDELPW